MEMPSTRPLKTPLLEFLFLKNTLQGMNHRTFGIVLEGIKVLEDLDNVALAVAMLFGLMYALNLSYPADLRYTFEVVQKIFMELDGDKLSNKALALKNRLFESSQNESVLE